MATKQTKAKPVSKITAADKVKAKAAAVKPPPKPASKTTNNPPDKPKASPPGRKPSAAVAISSAMRPVAPADAVLELAWAPVSTIIAANTHKAAAEIHAVLKHACAVTDFTRPDAWDYMRTVAVNNLIGSPVTRRPAAPHVTVTATAAPTNNPNWKHVSVMAAPDAYNRLREEHRPSADPKGSWALNVDAWLSRPGQSDVRVNFIIAFQGMTGLGLAYAPASADEESRVDVRLSADLAQTCVLVLGFGGKLPYSTQPDVRRMVRDLGLIRFNEPAAPTA